MIPSQDCAKCGHKWEKHVGLACLECEVDDTFGEPHHGYVPSGVGM